jgi:hypothetical protein
VNVTTKAGECIFEGPLAFPAGPIKIHVSNDDAEKAAYVGVIMLDEGKTIADLEAWPDTMPPDWVQLLGADVDLDAGKEGETMVELGDTPLYLVFIEAPPLKKLGRLGRLWLKSIENRFIFLYNIT